MSNSTLVHRTSTRSARMSSTVRRGMAAVANAPVFWCPDCGAEFSTEAGITRHEDRCYYEPQSFDERYNEDRIAGGAS